VSLDLGEQRFVFEDPRCFGRFHLDLAPLAELGPEPLSDDFTVDAFSVALGCSSQAVKVKLLDQSLVAGIGNIYASEALFRAGISPLRGARSLRRDEIGCLRDRIREVLADAIRFGGSVPLDWSGEGKGDALFYYGAKETGPATGSAEERFAVYGREGEPCTRCAGKVVRCVQAARSTFHCPGCQPG
jgi:formamidopyrimidine-DNA glycosylase